MTMMLPEPVLNPEELMCATCVFSVDVIDGDPESDMITCVKDRDGVADYPLDFCCGEGGWFVGGMDLIHNLIQALQYFHIKYNAERKDNERKVEV